MKPDPLTRIRAADARNNFAEILGRARFGGEAFLIEKQGKPFAVVIGIDEYRRLLDSPSPDLEAGAEGNPDGQESPSGTGPSDDSSEPSFPRKRESTRPDGFPLARE